MADAVQFRDIVVFSCYAGDDLTRSTEAIGTRLVHSRYGPGTVVGLPQRTDPASERADLSVDVQFEAPDGSSDVRTFLRRTLSDENIFEEATLPAALASLVAQQRVQLSGVLHAEAEERQRQQREAQLWARVERFPGGLAALARKYGVPPYHDERSMPRLLEILFMLEACRGCRTSTYGG